MTLQSRRRSLPVIGSALCIYACSWQGFLAAKAKLEFYFMQKSCSRLASSVLQWSRNVDMEASSMSLRQVLICGTLSLFQVFSQVISILCHSPSKDIYEGPILDICGICCDDRKHFHLSFLIRLSAWTKARLLRLGKTCIDRTLVLFQRTATRLADYEQ